MQRNVSKSLGVLLKVVFAVAVIYWMTHSGKLNLQVVGRAFREQWPLALFLLATLYLQVAIISWRWNVLNSALGFDIRYREAFSLSMNSTTLGSCSAWKPALRARAMPARVQISSIRPCVPSPASPAALRWIWSLLM